MREKEKALTVSNYLSLIRLPGLEGREREDVVYGCELKFTVRGNRWLRLRIITDRMEQGLRWRIGEWWTRIRVREREGEGERRRWLYWISYEENEKRDEWDDWRKKVVYLMKK